jgi:signal transduction histidine kinase
MPPQTENIDENPNLYLLRSLAKLNRPHEWKAGLDEFAHQIRLGLIYDHLVVYKQNGGNTLEPFFARAVGRGRASEADTAWGDTIGIQAVQEKHPVVTYPQKTPGTNRLEFPFGLGLPVFNGNDIIGAMVIIRFGGPGYSELDMEQAQAFASIIGLVLGNQKLQHKVDELTERCKVSTLQDNFISTITHELRSPLGFIKGYTTTLLRSDTTWDTVTQQEFLRIIDSETDHLQAMIDNLLDSARLQSNMLEIHLQPVRVEGLLNNIVARASVHHSNMIIHLHVIEPVKMVNADPGRLEQVFENLVTNAHKYAPESPLWITLRSEASQVIVEFRDEGPGIPPESQEKIFLRFYRDPISERDAHGSGLGLYICRQILDAHNGKISVESVSGNGSNFVISLPAME